MRIEEVVITHFRNLQSLSFQPAAQVNIIIGENGSGKTSVLESLYFLGRTRSFLTNRAKSFIQHEQRACTVYGRIRKRDNGLLLPVGVTRTVNGESIIKIAGDQVRSRAPLAELFPLQVIHPGAFAMLSGGSAERRQFIDSGVFHVEQQFLHDWRRCYRCVKQRNSLLKQGKAALGSLQSWDEELVEFAEKITRQRSQYIEELIPRFNQILGEISDLKGITVNYYSGWDSRKPLSSVLKEGVESDLAKGFTQRGPHRADLKIGYLGANAGERLSRGQQKIVVCALKLAQSRLFQNITGGNSIYLIDDLQAELDEYHRRRFTEVLSTIDSQVFATGLDSGIENYWPNSTRSVFHVKQGKLN